MTECIAFPRSPVRKLSGCDPHFRPSNGVAHCSDQRGPRAAGGNSVLFRGKSKFCAVGYSVGRARAESTERIRKSSGDREHDAFGQDSSPKLMTKQACTVYTPKNPTATQQPVKTEIAVSRTWLVTGKSSTSQADSWRSCCPRAVVAGALSSA